MTALPLTMRWEGDVMRPVGRYAAEADKQFVIGQNYRMTEWQERSTATHSHEFAWLAEAWRNLPESLSDQYPSPEHLRKRALIEAGYYDEQIIDAGTNAAALRVASAFRSREEFSLVIVRQAFVVIRTAKSQSRRAMDRKTFQDSKTAVMEIVAALIGVSPETLTRESGKDAA